MVVLEAVESVLLGTLVLRIRFATLGVVHYLARWHHLLRGGLTSGHRARISALLLLLLSEGDRAIVAFDKDIQEEGGDFLSVL